MTEEKDPVAFDELQIVRAPGFETDGFELNGFSPGINLIHGPNTAGKTTTAKAIEQVLWPDAVENGEHLVGQLSLNGEQWRVAVKNGRADYQRDGQDAQAPPLPSAHQRDRYRLSLHDLLQQETRNEDFAETIKRESAGGVNLSEAADTLEYKESPITRRTNEYQEAEAAVEEWRDAQRGAKGLEEERIRLRKLQNDLAEAKEAQTEAKALQQAITCREAQTELEDAQTELATFPDELPQVTGEEFVTVESLDDKIQELEGKKTDAEEQLADAKAERDETNLPEDGVSDGTITRLRSRCDTLESFESDRSSLESDLEGVERKRRNAREQIPLDVSHEDLAELDPGAWQDVSEFARTAMKLKADEEFQDSVKQWATDEDAPETDIRTLERGCNALESWLVAEPDTRERNTESGPSVVSLISAMLVVMSGVALGALIEPVLYGVSIIGIGLAVYQYWQRKQGSDEASGSDREARRDDYSNTGLAPPESWDEEAVRDRLMDLYSDIAECKIAEEREHQRDALIDDGSLERQQEAVDEKREELQESLGVAPETTDIEIMVIVRRILDWQAVHDEVVEVEGELDDVESSIEETRSTLQKELDVYDYEIDDSASAKEAIRNLEERKSTFERATRDLQDAEETIENTEEEIAALEEERKEIFTSIGLAPNERDRLQSLCEQVEEYEEAERAVDRADAVVTQERRKLEQLPGYDESLEDRDVSSLRSELRRVEDVAGERDQLQEDIADIEARIKEAKKATDVEEALAEKESALHALEDELHDDYSRMVGNVLVDHVQDVTIDASRPEVFQRANELLATISRGQYTLDLEDGEDTFRAFDTRKQKGFALDELSSGTRVQVLLAVRIAFIETHEQVAQIPIVLDETLANTDDLRAAVIIESMIELARDGRQIFYFTAQGDEIAKWRRALSDSSGVEWSTIDLADGRGLDGGVDIPDVEDIENLTPDPPEPADHDHDSYGDELDVASFNPYDGAGGAHLWYVVDDVDVLHDMLEVGFVRWGEVDNLLNLGRDGAIPASHEEIKDMRQNAEALAEFAESWCIGRGEPVDRSVLEDSGAVSGNFIDRVTALAEECDGDGERLVAALKDGEVNRFWNDKAEELEEYLVDQGYIVPQETLTEDAIRLRVIDRLMEAGVSQEKSAEQADLLMKRVARRQGDA